MGPRGVGRVTHDSTTANALLPSRCTGPLPWHPTEPTPTVRSWTSRRTGRRPLAVGSHVRHRDARSVQAFVASYVARLWVGVSWRPK